MTPRLKCSKTGNIHKCDLLGILRVNPGFVRSFPSHIKFFMVVWGPDISFTIMDAFVVQFFFIGPPELHKIRLQKSQTTRDWLN